jgi:hypothetical protein
LRGKARPARKADNPAVIYVSQLPVTESVAYFGVRPSEISVLYGATVDPIAAHLKVEVNLLIMFTFIRS